MSVAKFRPVQVNMLDGSHTVARAMANNAAWLCLCRQESTPLIAAGFPATTVTQCPSCHRRYRFLQADDRVDEIL
jgi:hypothetical protein